jgi:glycerol-3-phosphate dehydrogenase
MAEDTIDQASVLAELDLEPSATESLNIHGHHKNADIFDDLSIYGSDATLINKIFEEKLEYAMPIHPKKKTRVGEIIWAVRQEMARTIEDFLSRRTRHLLLDAKTSIEMAPVVAKWLAKELNKGKSWQKSQISDYKKLARNYIP